MVIKIDIGNEELDVQVDGFRVYGKLAGPASAPEPPKIDYFVEIGRGDRPCLYRTLDGGRPQFFLRDVDSNWHKSADYDSYSSRPRHMSECYLAPISEDVARKFYPHAFTA